MRFWVDRIPSGTSEEGPSQRRYRDNLTSEARDNEGVLTSEEVLIIMDHDSPPREGPLVNGNSPDVRERIPNVEGSSPPRVSYPRNTSRRSSPKRMFTTLHGAVERMVL